MKSHDLVILDNFNSFYNPQMKKDNWKMLQKLHDQKKYGTTLQLVEEDILNLENVKDKSLISNEFYSIIHLAAQPGVRESFGNREIYFTQNVEGTRQILKFALKANPAKVINFSSSTVYGPQDSYPLTEEMIPRPISPYGESKFEAENLCTRISEEAPFPIYTLRPFSIYGPQLRPRLAISTFTEQIMSESLIRINGNGMKMRDFTYVSDMIQAVMSCLAVDLDEGHHVFNVGNGNPVSINDLVSKLGTLIGKVPKVEFRENINGEVEKTWASLEKSSDILNFNPEVQIDEGLQRYINWVQEPNLNQLLIE